MLGLLRAPGSAAPMILCVLASCVLLAHEAVGMLCARFAPALAQTIRLGSATAVASMGWSWLSATQPYAERVGPVPLLVVLAMLASSRDSASSTPGAMAERTLLVTLLGLLVASGLRALPEVQPSQLAIAACVIVAALLPRSMATPRADPDVDAHTPARQADP